MCVVVGAINKRYCAIFFFFPFSLFSLFLSYIHITFILILSRVSCLLVSLVQPTAFSSLFCPFFYSVRFFAFLNLLSLISVSVFPLYLVVFSFCLFI